MKSQTFAFYKLQRFSATIGSKFWVHTRSVWPSFLEIGLLRLVRPLSALFALLRRVRRASGKNRQQRRDGPFPSSGRAKRETAKGRNRTRNAHFRTFSLIFGSLCKSRDLGVADLRRKPQIFAGNRRNPQIFAETGFSHLLSPFWRTPTSGVVFLVWRGPLGKSGEARNSRHQPHPPEPPFLDIRVN